LEVPVVVWDAKVETEEAKASDQKLEDKSFEKGLGGLDPGEELSVKKLRKMMKEYEKQEIESLPESDTIITNEVSTQVIDSTAYKRDSSYWEEVRPMPLTTYEVKGYERQDSIAALPPKPDDDKADDTLSLNMGEEGLSATVKKRSKFSIEHLITGGRYDLNGDLYLELRSPMQSINFNTVDGFYAGYELAIGNKQKKPIKWELRPGFLYTVSREVLN